MENTPPRLNSISATMKLQKNTARPWPSGWSAVGSRRASRRPRISSAWLPQSAKEWMASASSDDEPVATAPAVLAAAMARFAPSAKRMDFRTLPDACDIAGAGKLDAGALCQRGRGEHSGRRHRGLARRHRLSATQPQAAGLPAALAADGRQRRGRGIARAQLVDLRGQRGCVVDLRVVALQR